MSAAQWGYSFGYQDPVALEQRISDLEGAVLAAAATASAAIDGRYAVSIRDSTPASAVAVGAGATVLIPLPAITTEWQDAFWTIDAGRLMATNDAHGRYIVALSLQFDDNSITGLGWEFAIVRGHDLSTSPVIVERIPATTQVAILSEPADVTIVGELEIPTEGSDTEFAVFASHSGGLSVNLTRNSICFSMHRHRGLEHA